MTARSFEAFLEAFGSDSLVHQLLVDAGVDIHVLFSPVGDRRASRRTGGIRAGRYWGRLLKDISELQGWDEKLLTEAFVDYWFVYTVINSVSGLSRERGQSAFGFLAQLDRHLISLGAKFCPRMIGPRMPIKIVRHDQLEACFRSPRHTPNSLLEAAIPRIGNLFGERLIIRNQTRRDRGIHLSIASDHAPASLQEEARFANYSKRSRYPSSASEHVL